MKYNVFCQDEMLKYEDSSWNTTHVSIMIQDPSWKAVLSCFGGQKNSVLRSKKTRCARHWKSGSLTRGIFNFLLLEMYPGKYPASSSMPYCGHWVPIAGYDDKNMYVHNQSESDGSFLVIANDSNWKGYFAAGHSSSWSWYLWGIFISSFTNFRIV